MSRTTIHSIMLAAAAGILTMVLGCAASTRVVSNKAADFSAPVSSIGVVIKTSAFMDEKYVHDLEASLHAALEAHNVRVDSRALSGLELEEPGWDDLCRNTTAPCLLIIAQTGVTTTQATSVISGTVYEASLYTVSDRRRVWRASLTTEGNSWWGGLGDRTAMAKSVSTDLATQLCRDGVIAGPCGSDRRAPKNVRDRTGQK